MLPCVVTEISPLVIIFLGVIVDAIIMVVGVLTFAHIIKKDHKEEMDKKADQSYVEKVERDLKEEITTQKETIDCQEQTRIRENEEHKEYYQKSLDAVNKKLDMILQAIIDGKIKIKNT